MKLYTIKNAVDGRYLYNGVLYMINPDYYDYNFKLNCKPKTYKTEKGINEMLAFLKGCYPDDKEKFNFKIVEINY